MFSNNSIYVLLTDTGTLFTSLIKLFTGAPYNHASIALDAELNQVYSFGRKTPCNPLIAGFTQENMETGTFSRFPSTRCALLRIEVTDQEHAAIVKILKDFERNRGACRYNLLGLIGVLLKYEFKRDNAFFCSQFVAHVLQGAGLQLWDRTPAFITPEDIRQHPSFETVYEGFLFDYPLLSNHVIVPQSQRDKVTVYSSRSHIGSSMNAGLHRFVP